MTTLGTLTLNPTLSSGQTCRLRLRAVGTNPVQVSGYIERFNSGAWTIIGQATANDSAADRIAQVGSMGFSGHTEAGYAFDRLSRQRLGSNPPPTITSLTPEFATVGDTELTMTVRGTNFVPAAQVQWNGTPLTTTYSSPTRLTAIVSAGLLASVGAASVTVFNPTPGGGSSAARSFTVYAVGQAPRPRPVPGLTSITPAHVVAGSAGFALVANGSGFSSDSVIRWNGVALSTTYVSATRLQASVSASAIAAPASITVSVFTPTPGGGSSAGQILSVLESSAMFSDTRLRSLVGRSLRSRA